MGGSKTVETKISKISDRVIDSAAALVVIHGAELGRKFDLGVETVVGRSAQAEVPVDQSSVSREHARLTLVGKVATIEDLGSTNGTFVNDEKVQGLVKLRNGDLVKIGRTVFKYIAGGNIEGRYHEEIYRLTTTDGLTQVYNRRYFVEALEREVSRCNRYGRSLSLLMLDIDRFKAVNDTHGHLAGDHVLKQLATTLASKVRREDVIARYGGEEFGLILPEISLRQAVLTGERIRRLVEKTRFGFDESLIPVTLSAGASCLGGTLTTAQHLIKAADARLYEAKGAGRNCVKG